ncbi:hypothetical protein M3Y98_00880800 [Aphelenchoides besseyi]|nr:hypothetical protein M3Y98_00880800 [Aphelenchoides besseyi]
MESNNSQSQQRPWQNEWNRNKTGENGRSNSWSGSQQSTKWNDRNSTEPENQYGNSNRQFGSSNYGQESQSSNFNGHPNWINGLRPLQIIGNRVTDGPSSSTNKPQKWMGEQKNGSPF